MRDRTYYRSLPDSELVEQATYGEKVDWRELAIVLSERLSVVRDEIVAELGCSCDY
jgi:hypothetical protein